MCRRTACRKPEHLGGKRCQAAALLPKAVVSSSLRSISPPGIASRQPRCLDAQPPATNETWTPCWPLNRGGKGGHKHSAWPCVRRACDAPKSLPALAMTVQTVLYKLKETCHVYSIPGPPTQHTTRPCAHLQRCTERWQTLALTPPSPSPSAPTSPSPRSSEAHLHSLTSPTGRRRC